MAAVVAVTACCGSAAAAALCGGSPVAAVVPPVALGALDERLLVGTDASDLSTLAGVRGGTIGVTVSTQRQGFERQPFETRASGEATAYLKVDKPRFLFLEGSPDAVTAAGVTPTALPDASAAHAGASAMRAAPSVDRLAADTPAPAPGACSSAASAALGEEGAGSHLSGGLAPRHSPPPLPLPATSTPRSLGERVPAARAARIPRPSTPSAPADGSFAPSCVSPTPAAATAPRARLGSGCGRVGLRGVHSYPLLGRVTGQNHDDVSRRYKRKRGRTHSPVGRREA
jgi:hypothetical protein